MNLTKMSTAPVKRREAEGLMGTCRDALIDTKSGRIAGVVIDVKWGLGTRSVLLPSARITWADGHWTADLSIAEMEERLAADEQSAPRDAPDLPPLVVGPFGNTVAPMMVATLVSNMAEDRPPITPMPAAMEGIDGHWFAKLMGLPLFDSTGPKGRLADIVVDPLSLNCVSLVADADLNERHSFPFGTLRHIARGDDSIILELSAHPAYVPDRG